MTNILLWAINILPARLTVMSRTENAISKNWLMKHIHTWEALSLSYGIYSLEHCRRWLLSLFWIWSCQKTSLASHFASMVVRFKMHWIHPMYDLKCIVHIENPIIILFCNKRIAWWLAIQHHQSTMNDINIQLSVVLMRQNAFLDWQRILVLLCQGFAHACSRW